MEMEQKGLELQDIVEEERTECSNYCLRIVISLRLFTTHKLKR